jgi:hypothetical protein
MLSKDVISTRAEGLSQICKQVVKNPCSLTQHALQEIVKEKPVSQ